jgi:hypothetical protein
MRLDGELGDALEAQLQAALDAPAGARDGER